MSAIASRTSTELVLFHLLGLARTMSKPPIEKDVGSLANAWPQHMKRLQIMEQGLVVTECWLQQVRILREWRHQNISRK